MKFYFVLVVLMIGFVNAGVFCMDSTNPLAPANLGVTSSGTSIVLNWPASIDAPSCSGIDYYNVSRDGDWIGTVDGNVLTYGDLGVPYGTYSYSVFAVDLVGHNSGPAIKNDVVLSKPDDGGDTHVGGGSSSYSYVCVEDWECGEWSECMSNDMRRLCNDLNECGTELEKPDIYQECGVSDGDVVVEDEDADVEESDGFFSAMTGAVIGGGAGSWITVIVVIILAGGAYWFVKFKKFKK